MATLQRQQLSRLCSTSEVFEKAQSILCLAIARTRPGSGFVVKNPAALPAVCAYLASEQLRVFPPIIVHLLISNDHRLNSSEVSLQSAVAAVCVAPHEFSDILKKVRAALGAEEQDTVANVTYEALVDAYRVHPRKDVVACMEDAQAGFSRFDMLKERYGTNVVTCAVFYWVCQLMEEPSLQERSFCQAYSLPPKAFKAVVAAFDKQCEGVADQIKAYLLQKRSAGQASASSQASHVPNPASPQKSPVKPAIRPRKGISTPMTTPSEKRTVAFLHLSSGGHDGDGHSDNNNNSAPFPETPTKKRRIGDTQPSFDRMRTRSSSPDKHSRPPSTSTAAFRAAIEGNSPAKPPVAGPSTPRRPRYAIASDVTATPVHAASRPSTLPMPSPFRSQGQTTPARLPPARRRFRPVFLEQQQWCARDPKVEQMWAAAETLWDEMVELHGRPFQQTLQSAA